MNVVAQNFSSVFTEACRAKGASSGYDVTLFEGLPQSTDASAHPVVSFGQPKDLFSFSDQGIAFKNSDGKATQYSWDDLDFILPFDLSMASDKLYTFTDLGPYIRSVTMPVGLAAGVAAAVGIITSVVYLVIAIVTGFIDWLSSLHPLVLLLIVIAALLVGMPAILTFIATLVAAGAAITAAVTFLFSGAFLYAIAHAVVRVLQPLIERMLPDHIRQFTNGLYVVKEKWIKHPSGMTTAEILDFVLIGIKLRRAGLR
jgi:hypothetical protein